MNSTSGCARDGNKPATSADRAEADRVVVRGRVDQALEGRVAAQAVGLPAEALEGLEAAAGQVVR